MVSPSSIFHGVGLFVYFWETNAKLCSLLAKLTREVIFAGKLQISEEVKSIVSSELKSNGILPKIKATLIHLFFCLQNTKVL